MPTAAILLPIDHPWLNYERKAAAAFRFAVSMCAGPAHPERVCCRRQPGPSV